MIAEWWIDDKHVPEDRITKFEQLTENEFELHIEYYPVLRRPVRVNQVKRKSQPGETEQLFTVIEQEQILPDEGDGEQEPGLFLKIRKT